MSHYLLNRGIVEKISKHMDRGSMGMGVLSLGCQLCHHGSPSKGPFGPLLTTPGAFHTGAYIVKSPPEGPLNYT